jgi:hypothetical protein
VNGADAATAPIGDFCSDDLITIEADDSVNAAVQIVKEQIVKEQVVRRVVVVQSTASAPSLAADAEARGRSWSQTQRTLGPSRAASMASNLGTWMCAAPANATTVMATGGRA